MSGVRRALTRKFGPLPAWIWAVIVGVAIYIYRNRQGATTASGTSPADTLGYYGPYGEGYYGVGGGGSSGGNGSGTGNPAGGPPEITVNPPPSDGSGGSSGKPGTKPPKRKPKPKHQPPGETRQTHTGGTKGGRKRQPPGETKQAHTSGTKTRARSSASTQSAQSKSRAKRKGNPPPKHRKRK